MTLQRRAKKKTTYKDQIHNGANTFSSSAALLFIGSLRKSITPSTVVCGNTGKVLDGLVTNARWSPHIFAASLRFTFALFWSSMRIMIWWLGGGNSLWNNDRISGLIAPIYSAGVILWGGVWLGNHCYSTVAAHKKTSALTLHLLCCCVR